MKTGTEPIYLILLPWTTDLNPSFFLNYYVFTANESTIWSESQAKVVRTIIVYLIHNYGNKSYTWCVLLEENNQQQGGGM